jgi:hypothetical protein
MRNLDRLEGMDANSHDGKLICKVQYCTLTYLGGNADVGGCNNAG